VGRAMLERRRGCQINVASLTSHRPLRGVAPYAMSKAGLAQMTRALALEWGPRGVRVNAIAPGFIQTDLTRPLWERPEMRAWAETHTPPRTPGPPRGPRRSRALPGLRGRALRHRTDPLRGRRLQLGPPLAPPPGPGMLTLD
jgi:NAD(P)-dependent dehydrogenase (short-subunit alcohol dehydrogenase family)